MFHEEMAKGCRWREAEDSFCSVVGATSAMGSGINFLWVTILRGSSNVKWEISFLGGENSSWSNLDLKPFWGANGEPKVC